MASPGTLLKIWIKTAHTAPMRAGSEAEVEVGGSLVGSAAEDPARGVTRLDLAAWRRAVVELGLEVDPVEGRANLLVEGLTLEAVPGRCLRVGDCRFEITEETAPCGYMDVVKEGLRAALMPEARGGVSTRVTVGGTLHVGDSVDWVERCARGVK